MQEKPYRPHYYDNRGAAARLTRKFEINNRLAFINNVLRFATGEDKKDLQEEQESLRKEMKELRV